MTNKTEKIASTFLGKKVNHSESYDSSLLVAVPRSENRENYNIKSESLPFVGVDVWHAYEFSAMTKNGIPVTRLLKLKYDSSSEFIVESKSLKLYLNSFNMSHFGCTVEDCLNICKSMIEKDLSKKLLSNVQADFISLDSQRYELFTKFENIMNYTDEKHLKIEKFREAPELLRIAETEKLNEYYLMFDSLRSNCRVTHQPDFGDVYIYYKSYKHIKEDSLIKYLVSFRSEYHFHEECCEMIYKRLHDLLDNTDELFVCALYTRRGGIDICPVRRSANCTINDDENLIDLTKYARRGTKQ